MTAWPCTRQMFPAMGSPYLARMSAICWSAVFIPGILHQRSAVLAQPCSRFVLTSGTAARPGATSMNQKSSTRTAVTLCGLLGCPTECDQAVLRVGAHFVPPRGGKLRQALLGLCAPHQRDHSLDCLSPVEVALELTHKPRL